MICRCSRRGRQSSGPHQPAWASRPSRRPWVGAVRWRHQSPSGTVPGWLQPLGSHERDRSSVARAATAARIRGGSVRAEDPSAEDTSEVQSPRRIPRRIRPAEDPSEVQSKRTTTHLSVRALGQRPRRIRPRYRASEQSKRTTTPFCARPRPACWDGSTRESTPKWLVTGLGGSSRARSGRARVRRTHGHAPRAATAVRTPTRAFCVQTGGSAP